MPKKTSSKTTVLDLLQPPPVNGAGHVGEPVLTQTQVRVLETSAARNHSHQFRRTAWNHQRLADVRIVALRGALAFRTIAVHFAGLYDLLRAVQLHRTSWLLQVPLPASHGSFAPFFPQPCQGNDLEEPISKLNDPSTITHLY